VRIPRDASGPELVKALRVFGYQKVRQEGSHARLTTLQGGEHHVTIPNHRPLKLGTLTALLKAVAAHQQLTVEALVQKLGL